MTQKQTTSGPQTEVEKKNKKRESSPPSVPRCGDPDLKANYRRLIDQRFIKGHLIDWLTLEHIGLADHLWDLISIECWDQFFSIDEPIYWELTMEDMSFSELDRTIIILGQ